MSDHYFSPHPTGEVDRRQVQAQILDRQLRFYTGSGVFSKKGVDFGSRLLLESVVIPNTESSPTILDLGAGYGVIGIGLAKAYPQLRVTLVDINERAVQLAEANAQLNNVRQQVQLLQSDGFSSISDQRFDLIVCNPPIRAGKDIIYRLFQEASDHLNPGGTFWIVVRKQQGAASSKTQLESLFTQVTVICRQKGYWIIKASKN